MKKKSRARLVSGSFEKRAPSLTVSGLLERLHWPLIILVFDFVHSIRLTLNSCSLKTFICLPMTLTQQSNLYMEAIMSKPYCVIKLISAFIPRLFGLYLYLHHRIHSAARPLKILCHVGTREMLLGWVSEVKSNGKY